MQLRLISILTVLCVMPAVLCRHIDFPRERRAIRGYKSKSIQNVSSKSALKDEPVLHFRNKPPSVVVTSTFDSQVLACEAGGKPPSTIHWLKDGTKIPQSTWESIQLSDDDNDGNRDVNPVVGQSYTRSKLFLDCITPQDEGVYTCVAENPYIRVSTKTTVTVNGVNKKTNALCVSKKSFGTPARIHMWTHLRLEIMGSDVQVFCRASGIPRPSILWVGPHSRDGETLENGEKYHILANGDLIIKNIRWEDMGSYTCIAENSHGSDKISTFLYPTAPDDPKE